MLLFTAAAIGFSAAPHRLPEHAAPYRAAGPAVMQGGLFDALKGAVAKAGEQAMEQLEKEMQAAAMQDPEVVNRERPTGPLELGDARELPDSFEHSIGICVEACAEALDDGNTRMVVEFDTSAGDETYNLLSRSLKLVQPMLAPLADALAPLPEVEDEPAPGEMPATELPPRIQLLFPDEGTAAYVRQNWASDLPSRTVCMSLPRSQLIEGAEVLVLIAPQATEVPAVQRLLQQVAETAPTTVVILVNPKLVDMQSTGYGLVGRELRTMVADQFAVPFALKTYPEGALYRVFPEGWTVWTEDEAAEAGYKLAYKSTRRPSGDEIDELLYAEMDDGEDGGGGGMDALGKFIKGFQAM